MPEPSSWLESIPMLAGGRVLRQLSVGDSADTWLVEAHGDRFVLRVDRPPARRLGLDRAAEWAILQVAHAAGLAPRPLHSDPATGLLVTEYVAQPCWRADELVAPDHLERLGGLLHRVHEQPGVGERFDPHGVAQRYARASGRAGLGATVDEIGRLAEPLYAASEWCLCHHDAHAGNLLGFEPTLLVDWEYAARGRALFDLAVVIRYHHLDERQADILVAAWSGGSASAHREELAGFCRLYDRLTWLWQLALAGG